LKKSFDQLKDALIVSDADCVLGIHKTKIVSLKPDFSGILREKKLPPPLQKDISQIKVTCLNDCILIVPLPQTKNEEVKPNYFNKSTLGLYRPQRLTERTIKDTITDFYR